MTLLDDTLYQDRYGHGLRTPVMGPDGALYVTTDTKNGGGSDKILRITATAPASTE